MTSDVDVSGEGEEPPVQTMEGKPSKDDRQPTQTTQRDAAEWRREIQSEVARVVEMRLLAIRREEMLATYEELIAAIWSRLERTLGRVTVLMLMKRALVEATLEHDVLDELSVDDSGLSLEPIRAWGVASSAKKTGQTADEHHESQVDRLDEARDGLRQLILNLIDLLAILTGDIVTESLIADLNLTGHADDADDADGVTASVGEAVTEQTSDSAGVRDA